MSDAALTVIFSVANGTVVAAGWRQSRFVAPNDSFGIHALRTAIFFWALVVAAATMLGAVGFLHPAPLLVVVIGGAGLTWQFSRNRGVQSA